MSYRIKPNLSNFNNQYLPGRMRFRRFARCVLSPSAYLGLAINYIRTNQGLLNLSQPSWADLWEPGQRIFYHIGNQVYFLGISALLSILFTIVGRCFSIRKKTNPIINVSLWHHTLVYETIRKELNIFMTFGMFCFLQHRSTFGQS